MHLIRRLITSLLLLSICSYAFASALVGSGESKMRDDNNMEVHFSVNSPVQFTSFRLDNPPRLVIDIPDAQQADKLNLQPLSGQYLKQIRTGTQQGTDLRIVLDLTQLVPATTSLIKTDNGYELVVALGVTTPPKSTGSREVVYSQEDVKVAKSVPKKMVKIVIDPGHGGKDPGALGSYSREKDIVFNIARKLKDSINRESGFSAILTRNSDTFIPLRERILFARRQKADMFISIHADAGSSSATGSSVYILSTSGASSEAAKLLAQNENQSDLIGGVKLSEQDEKIASMLLDLSQDATIESSDVLAKYFLKNLSRSNDLHKETVERAGFAVLKSPDIPSVLIETGFISNPAEEKKLNSNSYTQTMAEQIKQGIKQYFRERPATTLLVASNSSTPKKKVVSNAGQEVLQSVTVVENTPPNEEVPSVRNNQQVNNRPDNQVVTPVFPPAALIPPHQQTQRINNKRSNVRKRTQVAQVPFRQTTSKSGETLADIAKRNRVPLSALKKLNELSERQLRVPTGTVLRLP